MTERLCCHVVIVDSEHWSDDIVVCGHTIPDCTCWGVTSMAMHEKNLASMGKILLSFFFIEAGSGCSVI